MNKFSEGLDLIPANRFASEGGLKVLNPADGRVIGTVKDCAEGEVSDSIAEATAAQPEWASRTASERGVLLKRWRARILESREGLAQLITAECGKPIVEARGEVDYGASFIEWFAQEARRAHGEIIPTHASSKRLFASREPVGVTAAITPWNFPVAMITRKAGPALAAGCSMIVKPAESTPLSALALEALAMEVGIPRGVFRVLPTSDPVSLGQILCSDPRIRKLSFTGSTTTGKKLLVQCAATVKRVSMELGGNAPFIVFDDADVDAAVEGAIASKYRNAGQTCVCANRFLVQSGIHDAFVERLADRASKLAVGEGISEQTEIGPLINGSGLSKVGRLVDQAVAEGARIITGGGSHEAGGNFFQPTVLAEVRPNMDIVREEIFGPVAPVIRFESESDAIRIANDTPYGLASYFYTCDLARAVRVSEALEYGMVGLNDGLISTEVAPFGGVKESGIGREGASQGLDEYLEIKYTMLGGLG